MATVVGRARRAVLGAAGPRAMKAWAGCFVFRWVGGGPIGDGRVPRGCRSDQSMGVCMHVLLLTMIQLHLQLGVIPKNPTNAPAAMRPHRAAAGPVPTWGSASPFGPPVLCFVVGVFMGGLWVLECERAVQSAVETRRLLIIRGATLRDITYLPSHRRHAAQNRPLRPHRLAMHHPTAADSSSFVHHNPHRTEFKRFRPRHAGTSSSANTFNARARLLLLRATALTAAARRGQGPGAYMRGI